MVKKYIAAEKSEVNDAEQSIVGWGSKPVPDRDGELIESSAWKLEQFRKNPVLMLSHNYSTPPVGKCLWVKSDSNGLKFKAKFANTDRGREIYQLYKDGIMNGFSVGFAVNKGGATDHPIDTKYKGLKRVYHNVELLEISCVAIPACPEALIEQVKSGKIVNKQLQDELEHIIHLTDETVEEKGIEEVETKGEEVESEAVITADDPVDEVKGDDSFEYLRKLEERIKLLEANLKASPVCPAGGEYGKDHGNHDQCGDCASSRKCKESCDSGEEEEESVNKKMLGTDGAPSVYDLMSFINTELSAKSELRPIESSTVPTSVDFPCSIVDLFPTNYPDGYVVYSCFDKETRQMNYYKIEYTYQDGKCMLAGSAEQVDQCWVEAKYKATGIVTKAVVEEEEEEAADLDFDETSIDEQIDLDGIEVKSGEIDIPENELKEILSGAVQKLMQIDAEKINVKDIVESAFRKAQGRVE